MAYTLGNKCAKNCCKRTILVRLIVEDVVTFFETLCRYVKMSGFFVTLYNVPSQLQRSDIIM